MTPDQLCAATAETQFGLFNGAQARAACVPPSAIKYRVRTGKLQRVLPEVYRISGSPKSWEQDAMAACLWAKCHVAVSHRAAARLWDLSGFSSAPVEITRCATNRGKDLGFRTHRADRFFIREITTVSNIPVTSMRRTLLDLAGMKHPRTENALDQALLRKLTNLGQLWGLYEEEWTRGRRGIAILRELLKERTRGRAPTESDLEILLCGIIRDFHLPSPASQYWIDLPGQRVRVDFCYPEAALIIETDGYAYHGDRESFDDDRARDDELQLLGWRIARFTWSQLRWRREWVAGVIRRHLAPAIAEGRLRSA